MMRSRAWASFTFKSESSSSMVGISPYNGCAMCITAKIVTKSWLLIVREPEREVYNTVGNHIHVCISQHTYSTASIVKVERRVRCDGDGPLNSEPEGKFLWSKMRLNLRLQIIDFTCFPRLEEHTSELQSHSFI